MSVTNLDAKLASAWETFADYSNNEEKSDSEVFEQEAINDAEMLLLVQQIYDQNPQFFSHPPVPPNRRRP